MFRRTSLPSRATTVALGGTAVLALSATALIGASGVSSAAPAGSSAGSGAVSYSGVKAAESAFHTAMPGETGIACTRPAPDGRVSTAMSTATRPDQLRAFYGLGPRPRPPTGRPDHRPGRLLRQPDWPRTTSTSSRRPSVVRRPTSRPSSRSATPTTRAPPATGRAPPAPPPPRAGPVRPTSTSQWAYAIAPKAHIVLVGDPAGGDPGRAGHARTS